MLLHHLFTLLIIIWHISKAGAVATECFQHDPELQLFTRALQQSTGPKIAPEAVFLWININN